MHGVMCVQAPRPGTYMPFGGGERICIGNRFAMLELKTMMALLVRQYTFAPDPEFSLELNFAISMTVKMENGLRIKLHRRQLPQ